MENEYKREIYARGIRRIAEIKKRRHELGLILIGFGLGVIITLLAVISYITSN